jgi:peptidoglycan/xylan/chitin deacetylase (PgdA/CDA1 family)
MAPTTRAGRALHRAPTTRLGRTFLPVVTKLRADNAVALTFDDGPDQQLDAFLSSLEEAEARATFFVVGEQVERAPSKLQEIVSCGHEIAVHCYKHRDHLHLAPRQAVEDMRRTKETIEKVVQRPVRLFRPPYVSFSLATWLEAGRQGWERIGSTRSGHDWDAQATPQSIVNKMGWPEAGDILLLHDSNRYFSVPSSSHHTLKALPTILERVAASGLVARSVGELLSV